MDADNDLYLLYLVPYSYYFITLFKYEKSLIFSSINKNEALFRVEKITPRGTRVGESFWIEKGENLYTIVVGYPRNKGGYKIIWENLSLHLKEAKLISWIYSLYILSNTVRVT